MGYLNRYTLAAAVAIIAVAFYFVGPRYFLSLQAVEIFVGNHRVNSTGYSTLATFPGNASGDIAPTNQIFLNNATAVARDFAGNLYVASDTGNQVQVYGPSATGLATRLRNLVGSNTGLHRPTGLAIDSAGNLYVAELGGPSNPSAILKFAPNADGDVAPIARIPSTVPVTGVTAATNTQLQNAGGVAIGRNGAIYVVNCLDSTCRTGGNLLIFAPNANGDVAPQLVVTGGLSHPQQVALDVTGRIFITNRGDGDAMIAPSITVHAAMPTADVAPMRTITSATLDAPFGLALDTRNNLFVVDPGPSQQNVQVFDALASGSVAPLRTIQGANTDLNDPLGITVRIF